MITLLKFDRYYSEKRNYINPAMLSLIQLWSFEKENSFILYKIPLKTDFIKSVTNKFGVKDLVKLDFSKMSSDKIFILNPSLLEKDISGMSQLFQHCQEQDIDIFTYASNGDTLYNSKYSLDNLLETIEYYNHQIFEISISEKTGIEGPKIYLRRDLLLKELIS